MACRRPGARPSQDGGHGDRAAVLSGVLLAAGDGMRARCSRTAALTPLQRVSFDHAPNHSRVRRRSGDYDDDDLWAELDALLAQAGSIGSPPTIKIGIARDSAVGKTALAAVMSKAADSLDEAYRLHAERMLARVNRDEIAESARRIASDPEAQYPIEIASTNVRKSNVAGLSRAQLLLLVVTWLIALSLPVVQRQFSDEVQSVVVNEVAIVALALAITDKITRK